MVAGSRGGHLYTFSILSSPQFCHLRAARRKDTFAWIQAAGSGSELRHGSGRPKGGNPEPSFAIQYNWNRRRVPIDAAALNGCSHIRALMAVSIGRFPIVRSVDAGAGRFC